jgi:Lytic transglycolase
MWTLLQHRPSMRDGPSFRRHTQSRLPRYPAKLSRIRTRNLSSEESRHAARKIAQPLDPSTECFPERPHTIRIGQEKQRAVPSFNRNFPTAAHRNLPFGTRVRVTDLTTSKSVIVRITDRGPRGGGVLDLSLGAARSLGITDRGVAQVRAEVL